MAPQSSQLAVQHVAEGIASRLQSMRRVSAVALLRRMDRRRR